MPLAKKHPITSPKGTLELLEEQPPNPTNIWIISHPHPEHGGTLNNKIVYTLSRNALTQNAISLRYNFRGVGQSSGTFSNNLDEKNDLIALWQWAKQQYPNLPITLAGFSFGAYISAVCEPVIKPEKLILIAPPVGKQPYNFQTLHPSCNTLGIVGKQDEIINPNACLHWLINCPKADGVWLHQAGHFFHGQLVLLKYLIQCWVDQKTP